MADAGERLASVNGTVTASDQAVIPALDPGFLRGYGTYELVRLYSGKPFALEEHLERLRHSANGLRLRLDGDTLRGEIDALVARAAGADCYLRIVVTASGLRVLSLEECAAPRSYRLGVEVHAPTPLLRGVKSLSYAANVLATRRAAERGFDDCLLVSPGGQVLEASTAAVFWFEGDRLCTPPLSEGILDSITRRTIMRARPADEV